jgi:thioredoxin 1
MNENVIIITDENYEQEVLQTSAPIVIDFYADWCIHCKSVPLAFAELAPEYGDKVRFAKINADTSKKLAIKSNVRSLPTLLFFKNGEEVDRVMGALDAVQLKGRLDALLS